MNRRETFTTIILCIIIGILVVSLVFYVRNMPREEDHHHDETDHDMCIPEEVCLTLYAKLDGFRDSDGNLNPTIEAKPGDTIHIVLVSEDGLEHDFVIDGIVHSGHAMTGEDVGIHFEAPDKGIYTYYCSIQGHRESGMEGQFIVNSGEEALERP